MDSIYQGLSTCDMWTIINSIPSMDLYANLHSTLKSEMLKVEDKGCNG